MRQSPMTAKLAQGICAADDESSSREMKPFIHSYRPPPPETYRLMLGCGTTLWKPRSVVCSGDVVEPTRIKRPKTGSGDDLFKRVRSLVRPLQV